MGDEASIVQHSRDILLQAGSQFWPIARTWEMSLYLGTRLV